jgi:PDZ domain-containing protein
VENFEAADSITQAASVPLPNGDAPSTEGATGTLAPPAPSFAAPDPPAAPAGAGRLPDRRHRRWAVPIAALGAVIAVAVVVSSLKLVDRYETAPGTASQVDDRVRFTAVPRYDADGKILFVTVAQPQLNGLAAFVGWLDPDVYMETKDERFTQRQTTPEDERQAALSQMRDAKNDAPYAALTKLGYPTSLVPGKAVVQFAYCAKPNADQTKCLEYEFPAGEFFQPADEITTVNGHEINTPNDVAAAIKGKKPGDKVSVTVQRHELDGSGNKPVTGEVELSADPDDAARTIFGIQLVDTSSVKLPFDIDIDTGAIGGPSAGLAFTLTLIDELTPGELTGGKNIAVTGTIDKEGNVGPIGGLHQKAVAVSLTDAKAFIVPKAQGEQQIADAQKVLGKRPVIAVSTLDEALAAMAKLGGNADKLGTPGKSYNAV